MKLKIETECIHVTMDNNEHLAVNVPIYQTSTFKFKNADHGAELFAGKGDGYIYTRIGNPTIEALEKAVATLEHGYKGIITSSGMAAETLIFSTFLKSGEHVISSESVYGPTSTLLKNVFSRFGIETTFVDTSNLDEIKNAIKPNTKMIYVETPANPTLVVTDIAEVSKIAKEIGAKFVVDNTFSSPILQQPLTLGADIVLHSMTKFLNGHADVVAGCVIAKNEEDHKALNSTHKHLGGIISPLEAFLVLRGIKTLALRMERHCQNAMKIAQFLENHPKVEKVFYPGLKSHPQHEVAKKQMKGYSAMISFELKGGLEAGKKMMNSVKVCTLAVSLGGVETLIQHPASMTHAGMPKELREQAGITDGLVRLSVGIENVEDLIADLDQAMS